MDELEKGQFRFHLTGKDVGVPGTPKTLMAHLKKLPASNVVQTAARVLHHLEQPGSAMDPSRQLNLMGLLPWDFRDKVVRRMEGGQREGKVDVLFHRQQMLALQKLALAISPPGPPVELGDEQKRVFAAAALQVNDISDQLTLGWMQSLGGMANRNVAMWMTRNMAQNRNVSYITEAGRAHLMWTDSRVPWPADVQHPDEFTRRRFGCSLRMATAIVGAPAFSAMTGSAEGDPHRSVLEPAGYFRTTAVDAEIARSVVAASTYVPQEPHIVRDESTYYGWADIAARPYLPAGGGLLTVSSPALTFARATTGVFWMLHEALSGTPELPRLTKHFGAMFEDYVLRLAEPIQSDRVLVTGEVRYGRPEKRSSDVLACQVTPDPPARAFIEVAALRPDRSVFDHGDVGAFDRFVDRVAGKLVQLDQSVRAHLAGEFTIPDDPLAGDVAYLPVLVVDEPFTWSRPLRDLLADRDDVSGLFRQQSVAAPVVCSVGEFESLIHAVEDGRGSLMELLRGYLMATDRRVPLEQYLASRFGLLDVPQLLKDSFDAVTNGWIEAMQLPDEAT